MFPYPCSHVSYCILQSFVSQFIDSGSGSSILGWIIPIRTQGFDDQKLEKISSWNFFFQSKIATFLSLGLNKGCPSYSRSRQPSKENIQHFKTCNLNFFLFLWVIFALLDPDPLTWLNPDPIRIRSRNTGILWLFSTPVNTYLPYIIGSPAAILSS